MVRKSVYSPEGKKKKDQKLRIEALGRLLSKKDEEIVDLMIGKGLLSPPKECSDCGGTLLMKEASNTTDGLRMKCSVCKRGHSVRDGSIFRGIKLPL